MKTQEGGIEQWKALGLPEEAVQKLLTVRAE
jgi:hypothetical protein